MCPFAVKRLKLFLNDEDVIIFEILDDDFRIREAGTPNGWGYEEIDMDAAILLRDFLNYAIPAPVDSILAKPIEMLHLSSRTLTHLKEKRIYTIKDLVRRTEVELLKIPSLGRKALMEIKDVLDKQNLCLGVR